MYDVVHRVLDRVVIAERDPLEKRTLYPTEKHLIAQGVVNELELNAEVGQHVARRLLSIVTPREPGDDPRVKAVREHVDNLFHLVPVELVGIALEELALQLALEVGPIHPDPDALQAENNRLRTTLRTIEETCRTTLFTPGIDVGKDNLARKIISQLGGTIP